MSAPTEEQIEAASRAICANRFQVRTWDEVSPEDRGDCREDAIAALAAADALRSPDERRLLTRCPDCGKVGAHHQYVDRAGEAVGVRCG